MHSSWETDQMHEGTERVTRWQSFRPGGVCGALSGIIRVWKVDSSFGLRTGVEFLE